MTTPFVTPRPWPRTLEAYGTDDTYRLAATWLSACKDVADWGGARGYFGKFLDPSVRYTLVDGTLQDAGQVLADLRYYHKQSEGILLRHVLDNTLTWEPILENALAAFTKRLVVVTFTPEADRTTRIDHANGYPVWHFNRYDLRKAMGTLLACERDVQTSHPEHVFYCARVGQ